MRQEKLVGVVCNRKRKGHEEEDAEFDEPATIQAICDALGRHGIATVTLDADATLVQKLLERKVDMVFNIAEGIRGRGRESQVPAILDFLGIPYTGSDPVALGLSMDKMLCELVASGCGVCTARHVLVKDVGDIPSSLPYPVIVKPNAEGSGKGISEHCIATGKDELERLVREGLKGVEDGLLVEEYLPGREFTVGVLGNGKTKQILPPMEILYNSYTQGTYKVYSYKVKCNYKDYVRYACPAPLSQEETDRLSDAAGKVFDALSCHDVARADFRMDAQGNFRFLEINPLPGLAPNYSDLPMIAQAAGIDYDGLVCAIYDAACSRIAGMTR
mgnify:CR=1 FL=1